MINIEKYVAEGMVHALNQYADDLANTASGIFDEVKRDEALNYAAFIAGYTVIFSNACRQVWGNEFTPQPPPGFGA